MKNHHLICCLLACFLLTACHEPTSPAAEDGRPVVRIGVTTALSGNLAYVGEDIRNGIRLAQEDLTQGRKYRYEFVFEDDRLEARTAALAAQRLIHISKVDALVSTWYCGPAIAPMAERAGITHFTIGWNTATSQTGPHNFNSYTSLRRQVPFLIDQLRKRNLRRVAFLQSSVDGHVEQFRLFSKQAPSAGIDIVAHAVYNPGDRDFRTIIAKAVAARPDVYILAANSPELELLGRQLHEAGVRTPCTGIENFDTSTEPQWFEGQWCTAPAVASHDFNQRYVAAFGHPCFNAAPFAYTIVELIVHAYENSASEEKPTSTQIAQYLRNLPRFKSLVGEMTQDPPGYFDSKPVLKMIRGGKPVVLEAQ